MPLPIRQALLLSMLAAAMAPSAHAADPFATVVGPAHATGGLVPMATLSPTILPFGLKPLPALAHRAPVPVTVQQTAPDQFTVLPEAPLQTTPPLTGTQLKEDLAPTQPTPPPLPTTPISPTALRIAPPQPPTAPVPTLSSFQTHPENATPPQPNPLFVPQGAL